MKEKKISIKILGIIFLIGIIINVVLIIQNNKKTNISKQETSKEQLTQTASSNAYVSMSAHLSETKLFMPIKSCAGTKQGAYNYTLYKNKGYSKIKVYGLDVEGGGTSTIPLIISGGTKENNMTEIFNKSYSGVSTSLLFTEPLSIDISSYEFVKITTGISNAYGRLVTLNYEIQ